MLKLKTCKVFHAVNSNATTCPELNVLNSSVRFVCMTYSLVKKENWQPTAIIIFQFIFLLLFLI